MTRQKMLVPIVRVSPLSLLSWVPHFLFQELAQWLTFAAGRVVTLNDAVMLKPAQW